MTSESKIYRVIAKHTASWQGRGAASYWTAKTLYCGTDLAAARVAYLRSEINDACANPGSHAQVTVIQAFDAEPDDIGDTTCQTIDMDA